LKLLLGHDAKLLTFDEITKLSVIIETSAPLLTASNDAKKMRLIWHFARLALSLLAQTRNYLLKKR